MPLSTLALFCRWWICRHFSCFLIFFLVVSDYRSWRFWGKISLDLLFEGFIRLWILRWISLHAWYQHSWDCTDSFGGIPPFGFFRLTSVMSPYSIYCCRCWFSLVVSKAQFLLVVRFLCLLLLPCRGSFGYSDILLHALFSLAILMKRWWYGGCYCCYFHCCLFG